LVGYDARPVKQVIWIVLFLAGVLGVLVPLMVLYTAAQLPQLDSEFDLNHHLKAAIESERMGVKRMQYDGRDVAVTFERPDFARLPKDLVALYISQRGCPSYFQTEREEGMTWGWRMLMGSVGREMGGDGWCERLFATRLAERIGAQGGLEQTVGGHKIHAVLSKDQLVAYDLFSIRFEHGVVGVDGLALKFFRKPLEDLQLSELAELMLALPPVNGYDQLKDCQNPSMIQKARDRVLQDLARDALVAPDRAKNAQGQPVSCTLD